MAFFFFTLPLSVVDQLYSLVGHHAANWSGGIHGAEHHASST